MASEAELSPQEKLDLIKLNLQETLNFEIIEDVILNQKRPLVIYWGTATTGRPHCAYFVAMVKIAQFIRAGCRMKILLADVHGFLDNLKAPIELVKYRAQYYEFITRALLRALNVDLSKVEFVLGSSYELSPKYSMDLLRLSTIVTEHDAKRAGAEVVKQVDNAPLSGLIYPLMQALDEEYLEVDVQFGGVDQRKIFILAVEQLPRIGYQKRAHLMNPMVPGLAGGKMSSSDPDSKIDILDDADAVKKKLKKSFAEPKKVEGNGILSFVQHVLLPVSTLKHGKAKIVCERREGEPLVYEDFAKMCADYEADVLTPQILKAATTEALVSLLEPIQAEYKASKEWQEVDKLAYPPVEVKKKEKKVKVIGTRFPGNKDKEKDVAAQPDGHVEGKDKEGVDLSHSAAEALQNLKVESKEPAE